MVHINLIIIIYIPFHFGRDESSHLLSFAFTLRSNRGRNLQLCLLYIFTVRNFFAKKKNRRDWNLGRLGTMRTFFLSTMVPPRLGKSFDWKNIDFKIWHLFWNLDNKSSQIRPADSFWLQIELEMNKMIGFTAKKTILKSLIYSKPEFILMNCFLQL